MKDSDKKLIYFSKSERRAIIIMILLILIFRLLQIFEIWSRTKIDHNYDPFFSLIDSLENLNTHQNAKGLEVIKLDINRIDVNKVTAEYLVRAGLDKHIAERWVKFRDGMGGFKSTDDIQKIYGMPKDWLYHFKETFVFEITKEKSARSFRSVERRPAVQLFHFDPNTVSSQQLKLLGFSTRTRQALLKYREKGGFFRSVDDLEFLHGMTPEFLEKISEYVQLEKIPEKEVGKTVLSKMPSVVHVDINESTAEHWQTLKGIGPYYSKRILNFRNHLGGFVSVDQVADTYGLPDSVFSKIKPYLKMDKTHDRININKVSKSELTDHPYFSRKQASVLINYRDEHGQFNSTGDLYNVKIFDSLFLARVEPYLAFQ